MDSDYAMNMIVFILLVMFAMRVFGGVTNLTTAKAIATNMSAKVDKTIIPGKDTYVSQSKYSWRFCHDGSALQVLPFLSSGTTWTLWKMEESPTLQEAIKLIDDTMKLKVTEDQRSELDRMLAEETNKPSAKVVGGEEREREDK